MDEPPKKRSAIAEITGATVGAVGGTLGTSAISSGVFHKQWSQAGGHASGLIEQASNIIAKAGKNRTGAEDKALRLLIDNGIETDIANDLVEGLRAVHSGETAATKHIKAHDAAHRTLGSSQLKGVSKLIYKNPNKVLAAGAVMGAGVAMTVMNVGRSSQKPQESFQSREDARRADTTTLSTETRGL